jgi:NitT/TauT family transport system substrate-binding protein
MEYSASAVRGLSRVLTAIARGRRRVLAAACATGVAAVMAAGQAQAADQVRFLTNWFAQAEHGGYYQALATGLYEKAGIDVSISMGGPQVNVMQLLLAGEADIIIGWDIQTLKAVQNNLPVVTVAAAFQHDLRCIMTRPDVASLADIGDRMILVATGGRTEWWPWLRATYGYTDEQTRPYTFNLQPFFTDPNVVQQCFLSSEPFQAQREGVAVNVFLLADKGYPPYGGPLITTRQFLDNNPDVVRRFVEASMKGWRDYLNNPEPANALIKEANPNMADEQIAFAIEQLKRRGVITGGDAATKGIGVITEERWQRTYQFLVDSGLLDPNTDWRSAFTTAIVEQVQVLPN